MANEVKVTKDLENKRLIIEREFDAPREKVWKAYAEKDWFEGWWGPEGWTTETKIFDFVPGGSIHYDMKCVDEQQTDWYGKSSWGLMIIDSVEAPNSFTYTDHFSDETGAPDTAMPKLRITNVFTEENGRTKLVSTAVGESAEQIEQLIQMGMVDGLTSQMTKLDTLLEEA